MRASRRQQKAVGSSYSAPEWRTCCPTNCSQTPPWFCRSVAVLHVVDEFEPERTARQPDVEEERLERVVGSAEAEGDPVRGRLPHLRDDAREPERLERRREVLGLLALVDPVEEELFPQHRRNRVEHLAKARGGNAVGVFREVVPVGREDRFERPFRFEDVAGEIGVDGGWHPPDRQEPAQPQHQLLVDRVRRVVSDPVAAKPVDEARPSRGGEEFFERHRRHEHVFDPADRHREVLLLFAVRPFQHEFEKRPGRDDVQPRPLLPEVAQRLEHVGLGRLQFVQEEQRPAVRDGRRELVRKQLPDHGRVLGAEQRRKPRRLLEIHLHEMLERGLRQFTHEMRLAHLPRAAQDQRLPRRSVLPKEQFVEQVPFHRFASKFVENGAILARNRSNDKVVFCLSQMNDKVV